MKRLVLVDGNALLHRAYHATPPLTTSKGELVNAVYGFTSMLLRAMNELKPDFIAVSWDKKGPTFRHQVFTQYKATRQAPDEGLMFQYNRVHGVIHTLNIPEFELAGFEADDLIGTLSRQALEKEKNLEVIIVTGDRDIMQLINKNIKVLMPKKTLQDVGLYGEEEFALRYGFEPKNLVDYKALAGDASDNIPGVNGIGDVTATKLVQKFGTVEKIYKDLFGASLKDIIARTSRTLPFDLRSKRKKENKFGIADRLLQLLAEGAESAVLSKKLVTLDLNAPIKLDLAKCRMADFDHKKAVKLFEELEFRSLVSRLPGSSVIPSVSEEPSTSSGKIATPDEHRGRNDSIQNRQTADLDLAVIPVLEKMSKAGIMVDLNFLEKFGLELKKKLAVTEKEIYSSVGHQFNLNSPKQLSQVLFDELKLPVIRKTKTGRSTDEATLNELIDAHPAIKSILEYRQLFKLISTYIDALPKYADRNNRIHSTFNVEGAATGRLSSQDPNLQNIPVRGQMGGEIRKAFIAPSRKVLLKADYSQIELRILAHLSDDPNLKDAFNRGFDIHALTASKVFKVPLERITSVQRNIGKTMNFATLYGQGPHALSKQLRVDHKTAKQYIDEYFAQFPKVREWIKVVLEAAYRDGYVETIWGRKRYFPELKSANQMFRAAGERAAINHPIQGSCADMIKKAMVEIDKELSVLGDQLSDIGLSGKQITGQQESENRKQKTDNCQLILQVHDELLFECSPKEVKGIAKMVKEEMENALKLSVPVVVDLKLGPNWGEMETLKV